MDYTIKATLIGKYYNKPQVHIPLEPWVLRQADIVEPLTADNVKQIARSLMASDAAKYRARFDQSDFAYYSMDIEAVPLSEFTGKTTNYIQENMLQAVYIDLLPFQVQGLQYTASGYGSKIPTKYKAIYNGKKYRVYTCIFSNIGSLYIVVNKEKLFISDYMLELKIIS